MTPKTIDTKAVAVRGEFALSPEAEAERARFLPVMNVPMAMERRNTVLKVIRDLMHEGEDYGAIPGAGTKKCLLQPGAQKLDNIFGLVPTYQIVDKELDWTGEKHAGEPFFNYEVRCILMRGDFQMGEGIGQCSSWESKYRWRKGERKCPTCGAECIIKGKAEYGGGWLCFAKKGGCGAKFSAGDSAIESQETGRRPNPDIHDQVNTILKMAEKRAHLLATINATSASEFLTQDVVDEPPEERQQGSVADRRIAEERAKLDAQRAEPSGGEAVEPEVLEIWQRMGNKGDSILAAFKGAKAELQLACGGSGGESEYYRILGNFGVKKSNEFVKGEKASATNARKCIRALWQAIQAAKALGIQDVDGEHLRDAYAPADGEAAR